MSAAIDCRLASVDERSTLALDKLWSYPGPDRLATYKARPDLFSYTEHHHDSSIFRRRKLQDEPCYSGAEADSCEGPE